MGAIRRKIGIALAGALALAGCGDKAARNEADAVIASDVESLSRPGRQ